MNLVLTKRERIILATALREYESLANTTERGLTSLALPTLAVQEALANVGAIRDRMGTSDSDTSQEMQLNRDLLITAKDALDFYKSKCEKVKKDQLKLAIETNDTEHTVEEVDRLRTVIAGQPMLELASR